VINTIILDLSHFYRRRRALKLSLFSLEAFLVNCSNRAFSILFSIIKSCLVFISNSNRGIAIIDIFNKLEKAYFIKIAFFSSTIVAISPFKNFIVRVIEKDLIEVYFRAVQHLFLSYN
jgi:hypothetical protein